MLPSCCVTLPEPEGSQGQTGSSWQRSEGMCVPPSANPKASKPLKAGERNALSRGSQEQTKFYRSSLSTHKCAAIILCSTAFPSHVRSSECCGQVRHQKPVNLCEMGQLGPVRGVQLVLCHLYCITAPLRPFPGDNPPPPVKADVCFSEDILYYSVFNILPSY